MSRARSGLSGMGRKLDANVEPRFLPFFGVNWLALLNQAIQKDIRYREARSSTRVSTSRSSGEAWSRHSASWKRSSPCGCGMRRPASAPSRRIFSARSAGEDRGAMAARASTSAGARGLASGAEAGKELEHGAVEGLGLIPVGEVTGGREQDELGVRDLI